MEKYFRLDPGWTKTAKVQGEARIHEEKDQEKFQH